MSSCILNGPDHDDCYEEIVHKQITSKKDRICCECKEVIPTGIKFEYFCGAIYDDDQENHHHYRTCSICQKIRDRLLCNWTYSGIFEDIREDIFNNDNPEHIEDKVLMKCDKEMFDHLLKYKVIHPEANWYEDKDDE